MYIVNDNEKRSFIAAYDKRTGAEAWRVDRDEESNWSTPFVWENERRTEIVTAGTGKVRSYDLDGKLLWELKGMTWINVPSPFAKHGLLYISSGWVGDAVRPVYAIRPGAAGDISLKEGETANEYITRYQRQLGTYNTSPLVYGDYFYTLFDRGFLACHDARTGKQIYGRQRIGTDTSGFTASPWVYNGKIFVLSEDGDTFVIQAGPEFKVLGKNSLDEMALATPAIARGASSSGRSRSCTASRNAGDGACSVQPAVGRQQPIADKREPIADMDIALSRGWRRRLACGSLVLVWCGLLARRSSVRSGTRPLAGRLTRGACAAGSGRRGDSGHCRRPDAPQRRHHRPFGAASRRDLHVRGSDQCVRRLGPPGVCAHRLFWSSSPRSLEPVQPRAAGRAGAERRSGCCHSPRSEDDPHGEHGCRRAGARRFGPGETGRCWPLTIPTAIRRTCSRRVRSCT